MRLPAREGDEHQFIVIRTRYFAFEVGCGNIRWVNKFQFNAMRDSRQKESLDRALDMEENRDGQAT